MACCDAILSRRDLQTRRAILKDSHVGSFAVMAIAFLFLLSNGAVASSSPKGLSGCLPLALIPAISRSCSSAALFHLKPMDTSSYRQMKQSYKKASLLVMLFFALLPLAAALWMGLSPVKGLYGPVCMVSCWLAIGIASKDLQGMSGDVSGFAITVGELCALLCLALLH